MKNLDLEEKLDSTKPYLFAAFPCKPLLSSVEDGNTIVFCDRQCIIKQLKHDICTVLWYIKNTTQYTSKNIGRLFVSAVQVLLLSQISV